jgi:CheY-like chemotaxis protein
VHVDRLRLAQVVSNLLNNAAKYSAKPGTIRLDARRDAGDVVLTVRDDGVGIPADMIARVFEPFVQVRGSRDRSNGGLGIGLTLVKRLVDLHGGSVEADSGGLGRGSTFVIRLPAAAPVDRIDAERATPDAASPLFPSAIGRKILVIDDNVDAAKSMALMLEGCQHEVHVFHDGPTALAAAARIDPDVVLLDLAMPEMDGFQVARTLRESHCRPGALLIAVTGYGLDDDRRRTAEAGFDFHLVKPVDLHALQALIGSRS